MKTVLLHAGLIGTVLLMGALIGVQNPPGDWYAALKKPSFTPPAAAFGVVWTILYIMIGWVGARKLVRGGAGGLWVLQMALNFAYEPLFFGLRIPFAALIVSICLLWTIVAFIRIEWHADRLSALLFVPYAVWVTLASLLNLSIVALN